MKTLADIGDRTLTWQQPRRGTRQFQLSGGDDVLARLSWQTAFGSLALAELGDERYTFKRSGFFQPRATIRREGSEDNVAVFTPAFGGAGSLELANAPRYRWAAANFWHSRWAWFLDDHRPLVAFEPTSGLFRHEATVTLHEGIGARGEALLLVAFGWYLLQLHADDEAAAAAAVVVACG